MKTVLLAGALLLLIGAPAVLFFLSSSTTIALDPEIDTLGAVNTLAVRVHNPHGVRVLRLVLSQDTAHSSAALQAETNRFLFWKRKRPPATFQVKLTADPRQGFRNGPAKLTLQAISNDFRGRADTREYDVRINLAPPTLAVDSHQHYINQGGAALVTFSVSGYWTEAGVRVGKYEFRSFPLPGAKSENQRFCLFAFPWDVPADAIPTVFARNPAGQEATAGFWHKVFPKNWRRRQLPISDAFIEKVVNELDPTGHGAPLDRFLRINGPMRHENNKTLSDLRLQTQTRMLWTPPFEQLASTQVEALFADIRTYTYEGKQVDEQTHLGFDLSKVARAPVLAANSGQVIFAGALGIYGNCVVIDHGYALQSIYAHLSEIAVKPGQTVEKSQEIGRSGATGLAAGDHLHFSMLIDGVQVNPIEWWDPKWIDDRILNFLNASAAP